MRSTEHGTDVDVDDGATAVRNSTFHHRSLLMVARVPGFVVELFRPIDLFPFTWFL